MEQWQQPDYGINVISCTSEITGKIVINIEGLNVCFLYVPISHKI